MRLLSVVVAVAGLFAAGCSLSDVVRETAPKDAVALAEKTVRDLRAQDQAALAKDLMPATLKQLDDRSLLTRMLAVFPADMVSAVVPENWSRTMWSANIFGKPAAANPEGLTRLTLRYEFQNRDAVRVRLLMAPDAGTLRVQSLSVEPLPAALLARNAVSNLWTAFQTQHIVLAAATGLTLFVLFTALLCWRTEGLKYKTLWMVVILIGAVQFTMSWETGKLFVAPFVLKFPPMWLDKATAYDPVVLWFVLPLGAVLFRLWRKHLGLTAFRSGKDLRDGPGAGG